MKLCVVSSCVFPVPLSDYGGLEQIAYHCAEGLAARGHDVSLVAPEGSSPTLSTLIPCGPPGRIDERHAYAGYWHRLPEFDAVISHDWQKWSTVLQMEGKLTAPVLKVLHAPVGGMFQSLPPIPKPCFVAISNDQREDFRALFPGAEARVCHNGVDPEFYKSTGVPRTDRYLFLARFSSIKGADLAIEACLRAGAGLDIVGDTSITHEPDYYHYCVRQAQRSSPGWDRSKGRQIHIVGPASRGACVGWFSRAKALLHPNERFREPFGLAPVEAMQCGTPCISFDHGAMRETITEGISGRLVRSLDEMVEVIKSDWAGRFTEADRRACRGAAVHFSVANMAARYEELCHEAIRTGGW